MTTIFDDDDDDDDDADDVERYFWTNASSISSISEQSNLPEATSLTMFLVASTISDRPP
eukprot:CAMPEP_0113500464 /NCGR_PEP_ID=MMETSP0014_2-20120614/32345_1 /TAXON_ID=2857 /ORGANISM="Nitzschia sp." /LENGTH=58 /DNA_ID=CAMNT_0000394807 /DNA_START=165 /DNA_END=341 /DNA_ORIENTATION=+ /assembly_acc=CAM_ASM_000159